MQGSFFQFNLLKKNHFSFATKFLFQYLITNYNKNKLKFQQIQMIANCFFLLLCLLPFTLQQCCTKLVAGSKKCAECPQGTHLFRGSCLMDVQNCLSYSDGFACSSCKQGFNLNNGQCSQSQQNNQPKGDFEDKYLDINTNDNLMILSDYSRSINKELETAEALFGIVRKYNNGTQHTIIQYETKNTKYFQSIGQFDPKTPFAFKLLSIKELPNKPSQNIPAPNPYPNPNPPNPPSLPVPPTFTKLAFEQRQKDKGFKVIDTLVRNTNVDTLGNSPIVISAYYLTKGLNTQYYIYYETTDKKSIFENRSIYQIIRDKAFIVSLTKTTLR